ncbi:outer membrane protein assembly factor BamE [Roseinatronobacter alkalisoli]|uniref:Outer membrane protein assembly factor BamE n=1 Tax=Roseinatronobacter alkalisoli TaxID=3028235 RepID=A0ABT5T8P2_9RHOB|nr:outer membrane protein assembly factor BamE [Roseinatronobacter sp. HJB301]MDD7971483.1 outer membrane protein assembly factor BamE [Roseinatronobacter sp. HJB301]
MGQVQEVLLRMRTFGLWILSPVLILAFVACSPVARFHGYAPDDMQLAEIEVGRDTRQSVEEKIGRPGVSGVMEGSGWFYVQSDWIEEGWRAPVEVDRQIVAISFDSADRVSNIERFGLEDGEIVALSRRVTDTGPSGMSVLRQLMSNFGRFNPAQMLGG